jgi:hypothetical protein
VADGQWSSARVEEDDVELEAHAEGVDAGAARQQQAGVGLVAWKVGEAEESRAESDRDRDFAAEDPAPRKGAEAIAATAVRHWHSSRRGGLPLPSHRR